MRLFVLSFMFAAFATVVGAQQISGNKAEASAVKVPLENYLKAQATGEAEFVRKAFHPDARIMSFRGDKLNSLTVAEFAGFFKSVVAEDESKRTRSIESIDISGNAAVAKIVLDYPTVRFVDYMSLLKIDGEWKIINKAFYAEPKEKK